MIAHKLGELIDIQSGYAFKSKEYSENGHFLVRIGNVQDGYLSLENPRYVVLDTRTSRFALNEGDFLTSLTGNIGRVARVEKSHLPAALNQRVARITVRNSCLSPSYLFYFLSSDFFREELISGGHGTAQQNVSPSAIGEIKAPIPSLPEQQRIVRILDEAFDGIATAKANAEKNVQNARKLFESYLNEVFTNQGEGWVDTRLGDVSGFQNGFAFKSSTFKSTGVPVLRISNIQNSQIDRSKLVFVDQKDYRENLERYVIIKDDLLIAMSGATTGKLGFNTEDTIYYLNQRVGKFEPGNKLNKRFLYYFLSTKVKENLSISAGAAQPNLSTEQINNFILPLPRIDEQNRIVADFEKLYGEVHRIESNYNHKIKHLENLKRSILHQAFTGQL
jgi:type I restriction enzyme, S subunit